jgi:hypothetical protein
MRRIFKVITGFGGLIIGALGGQILKTLLSGNPEDLTKGIGLIFLLGAFGLGLIVLVVYILNAFWLEPATRNSDIITAALRYLYHLMFNLNPGQRITFLAPRNSHSTYIRPRYRYAYGNGTRLASKARFRRGSALAGMAWDNPGGDTVMVRELPDFANDELSFLKFMHDDLKIPLKEVKRLSRTIRISRWIYCYGIVEPSTGEFIGVISLDSTNPDALSLVDNELVQRTSALIANVVKNPTP